MAATGPQVIVQVADRLGQPGVVGGQHRPSRGWVTQAVEDRHALGRPQDHVKARHGVAAMGAAEELAGVGVAAFALQAERTGAGAVPPAWGLAVAGQILLVVGGQLAGVIRPPPYRQLGDVGHHPPLPSSPSLAPATHPWCSALLGKRLRLRVAQDGDYKRYGECLMREWRTVVR
jgi:hypothetical protein